MGEVRLSGHIAAASAGQPRVGSKSACCHKSCPDRNATMAEEMECAQEHEVSRGVDRATPLRSSSPRVPPCGGTTRCHCGPLWDLSWSRIPRRSDYPSLHPGWRVARLLCVLWSSAIRTQVSFLSEWQVEMGLPGVALRVPPPSGGCGSPLQRSGRSQESGLSRDTDGRRKTEGC